MPASVVDASVVAALFFHEPEEEKALALVGSADIVAPVLLAYELTNVAWKKARKYPEQRADLSRNLELALSSGIRWVEVSHLQALDLALGLGITAYDASYVYLATTLDLPLATLDQKLLRAWESAQLR